MDARMVEQRRVRAGNRGNEHLLDAQRLAHIRRIAGHSVAGRVRTMRVSVVGLGPGPLEWITPAAAARLRLPGARVFVRTRLFPNLELVLDGVAWQSFDDLYEQAESLADVQVAM